MGATRKPKNTETKGQAKRKKDLVDKMIHNIEERLDKKELKPTLGDFIRLVQLEKELEEEQPREIKVTWIEPSPEENASET